MEHEQNSRRNCANQHRNSAKIAAARRPTVLYISIFYIIFRSPQGAQLWHPQNSALACLLRAQKFREIHRCWPSYSGVYTYILYTFWGPSSGPVVAS